MIKRAAWVISVLALFSMFSGCAFLRTEQETYTTLPKQTKPVDSQQGNPTNDGLAPQDPTKGGGGLHFESTNGSGSGLISGSLVFSIHGARAVTSIDDVPNPNGFDGSCTLLMYVDGQEQIYHYPDDIPESGSFLEGSYLVLVDVTVESKDAVGRTQTDNPPGKFSDPYLFDARSLFTIVDTGSTYQAAVGSLFGGEKRYTSYYTEYYSRINEFAEDRMTYRLLPGEQIDFTIGCIVGNNEDGSSKDLSSMCARVVDGADGKTTYVNLGLDGGRK